MSENARKTLAGLIKFPLLPLCKPLPAIGLLSLALYPIICTNIQMRKVGLSQGRGLGPRVVTQQCMCRIQTEQR